MSVLASAGFTDDEEAEAAKRPNVQVGDPYEEKRLIEACLQLLDESLVVGIQDLGGAGLTCATSETASRGGVGMDVDVNAIPRREPGMEAWEVMTSESQERMLAIVTPEDVERVLDVCAKWEVRASVIGKVTDTGQLRIMDGYEGEVLADVPAASLHEDAPLYHRPMQKPERARPTPTTADTRSTEDLLRSMLVSPEWVFRQYDHQLFLNTVAAPGQSDAALLRLSGPGVKATDDKRRAIALSTDGNAKWCAVDPRQGTALTVAESALNVACVGAEPVALVNCLNFGNPEHPEVMWQLSEAIDGMSEACLALDIPVIGGNVSLYNESKGRDIDPTPVVGVLGLVEHLEQRPAGIALNDADTIVLVEAPDTNPSLAGSKWATITGQTTDEDLAPLDLEAHKALIDLVRSVVNEHIPNGVHDVSEGGIALALAEMAVASQQGFEVEIDATARSMFGEAPSRVLFSVSPDRAQHLMEQARRKGLEATAIGSAGGDRLVIRGAVDLELADATRAWKGALPEVLALVSEH